MGSTILNTIQPEEVSMALEHFLVAPAGTAWVPGLRIDVSSPPAGFAHMGSVLDDSPSLSVSKDFFRLTTGIPSVLAYQAVTQLGGEFSIVLNSFSQYATYIGLGGLPPYNVPATTAQPFYTVVSTTTNGRTQVAVNSSANWAVNDMVVTDSSVALLTSRNYAWISSVTATSITLSGEGFKDVPVAANPIIEVAYSRYALGTNVSPELHLLGVADFLNGAQIIHDMPHAQPKGQWSESLRPGGIVQVACAFDLFGYTITSPYSTAGQIIVGERILLPPTTVQ